MRGSTSWGRGNFSDIKSSLIAVLAVLSALFILPTGMDVYRSYQRLAESQRMVQLLNIGIDLFQAVRHFGYERGRTNVVLNHAGPPEEMAVNRAFIKRHRQEGEQSLTRALDALSATSLPGLADKLTELRASRDKVSQLRPLAEADMLLAKERRDPRFPSLWFAGMSGMVTAIRELLENLCGELAGYDGATAVLAQLMLTSSGLRDECAPEMALLSGVMLSGQPLDQETRLRIVAKRGMSQQLWNTMRVWSQTLGSPQVTALVERFRELYFEQYLPLGREVLAQALHAGPYRLSQKEFLSHGVAAVEALAQVMGGIVEVGKERASQAHGQARRGFITAIALLALGLALIAAALTMIVSRVINPLAQLTLATRRIAERNLGLEVPYRGREDEIGSVARALDILQGNTRQMVADYEALRESKAALERALAEVRALSGLLPICSNCKKIRDDGGYWRQLEVYISEHSQAQFSHGICPDCARKLYPEYIDDDQKTD